MKFAVRAFAPFLIVFFCLAAFSVPAGAQAGSTSEPGAIIQGPSQVSSEGGAASANPPIDVNSLPEAGVPVEPSTPPPETSSAVESTPGSKAPASSARPASSSKAASSKPEKKPAGASSASSAQGEESGMIAQPPSSALAGSSVSSGIVLPTVSVESGEDGKIIDSEIIPQINNNRTNWIGIIAWVCIALGVLVVLIVVLSNRRPPHGGNGRKRYRRPKKVKKHLLNDKYYRNL